MCIQVQVIERFLQCSLGRFGHRYGVRQLPTDSAEKLLSTAGAKAGNGKKTKRKSWETNRGVGANILSDPGSVADLAVELVLVDAVGASGFADVAGAAGKHELVGDTVFLGVEQIGAGMRASQRPPFKEARGECS